ncbi:unnamed protein product, partial [Iphiclides podalirius]
MDEEYKEDKSGLTTAHRSPTFSKEETKALVNIIEKYKSIILNKSTSAAASHSKEAAWNTIAKMFNSQGFKYSRSADTLKTKWENLKREARKLSKNLIDVRYTEINDLTSQVVTMLCEAEKDSNVLDNKPGIDSDSNGEKELANIYCGYWDECDNKQSEESDEENATGRSNRSLNFSPQECRLLLKCVRAEKKDVFCKVTTGKANTLKNSAWRRITDSFNKQSPQKRTTKVLRTKFTNMKRLAKSVNLQHYLPSNGHERLGDTNKEIKIEPVYECKTDIDVEIDNEEIDSDDHNDSNKNNNLNLDPLDAVLNGESELGPMSHFGSWSPSESKDVVNLKLKLLNYQLESAKMERKRLEASMAAEAEAREALALERILRLRAARLDAVAAELRLPSEHPALQYTVEETRAQQYLQQHNHT